MSVFYNSKKDMLQLKCNGCDLTENLYKGQTDRTVAHDWIHTHGWRTMKINGEWQNLCPDCYNALRTKTRERWLGRINSYADD